MTVPSTTRRAGPFTGTGALTSYPFTFKVFAKEDLAVTIADEDGLESTLVLDSSFLVTLNGDQETTPGGSVQYAVSGIATALPAGYSLAITGEGLEYEQTADLPQGGNFNPVVIENALDRQMMLTQLLRDVVTRALQLSVTTPAGVDATLPTPVANNFIGWDSAASGLRNIDPNTLATIVAFASWQPEKFSGDGVTTQFTLAADPGSIGNMDVSVGGVTQRGDIDFTLSGRVLTFTTAPYAGTNNVYVRYGQALPEGTSTLETALASTASASDGAGRVWWDYDNAYTAFNGSGAAPIGTKLNLIERDVEEFGASTSGTAAANATAIQSAFTWLKENGGCLKFKPNGTYAVNAALTLLIDSSARKLMSRVVDFRGCTLDWSSSGLTSGVLLTVGATSVSYLTEIHKQELRGPLRIIGPQGESGSTKADFSWMNAPSTTVVGLRTQYAQNWLFSGLTIERCFTGRQRFWTWDDTWLNCTFRKHFYGEESQEACTTGTHIQCAFTYCALPILYRIADTAGQSSSAQTYLDCRAEQSHALAALDPGNTSGGGAATDVQINGIDFRNLYVEALSTATDLIRVGTKVVDADIITALSGGTQAFSPGADQDKYITNISLTLAKFNHTLSSSSKLFSMPSSGNKCFGFDVVAPANPIDDVRNPNKMQSKRWLMAHSKTNVSGQKHIEYSSNRARAIIDGSGTPPTFLQQEGNFSLLRNWPSALGGTIPAGGSPTLGTGEYEISLREDVYSSVLSHNVIGTCSGGGVDGIVVADYGNSGRSYIRIRCVNQAGAAFNPSRVTVQWEGALGEI